MTVGDIRAQALQLMGEEDGRDIRGTDIEDLLNRGGELRRLLVAMPGSIDRALSVIEGRLLTVAQSAVLTETGTAADGHMRRFALPTAAYSPLSVTLQGTGHHTAVPFIREGGSILLPPPETGDSYLLWYYPCLPRMSAGLDNTTDLETAGVPRLCANAIPYYIKGELYEREEPTASAAAFERFEAMLAAYAAGGDFSSVKTDGNSSPILVTEGQDSVCALFEVGI